MPVVASLQDIPVTFGTIVSGTVNVSVQVRVPVSVPLTYVSQIIVHKPDVELGNCSASIKDGSHTTESPTSCARYPLSEPKVYRSVCVAAVEARFVKIVTMPPTGQVVSDTDGTLAASS